MAANTIPSVTAKMSPEISLEIDLSLEEGQTQHTIQLWLATRNLTDVVLEVGWWCF